MSMLVTAGLAVFTAVFYMAATFILKHWSDLPPWVAFGGAFVTLALACLLEVEVLRRARFADVVVLIIALEVLIALALSRLALGEVYTVRDLVAFGILALGMGLLLTGEHASVTPDDEVALRVASTDHSRG